MAARGTKTDKDIEEKKCIPKHGDATEVLGNAGGGDTDMHIYKSVRSGHHAVGMEQAKISRTV